MSDYNDGILPTPCLRMDTHFGDEYESVEFGDGTGYIKAAPILAKVGSLHEEIDRLWNECAELRELCANLYDHAAFSIDYFGDAHGILPRMRELGIEVDE